MSASKYQAITDLLDALFTGEFNTNTPDYI
jgi:hypothetical protein